MTLGAGLLLVDKPAGWTSHDVVARVRRLAGTRRVGHAGTLDPMATGVLVVGIERATRLLGHLSLADKTYDATVALGESTSTDDAEGESTGSADASHLDEDAISAAAKAFVGEIQQVPPGVSAISVGGVRSYARVRRGEEVVLPARPVTVHALDVLAVRRGARVEVDLHVHCSTGTYVRALARDLGAALGVGGHLSRLRRTTVGPFHVGDAASLESLQEAADHGALDARLVSLDDAAERFFPLRRLAPDEAEALGHGRRLAATGRPGTVAAVAADGTLVALVSDRDELAVPLVVFRPA
jgi:tRNA pseudouridine55 synthase